MNNPQPWWLTWPPAEVAAAIVPLFASAAHASEDDAMNGVVSWFKTGNPIGGVAKSPSWFGTSCPYFENPDYRAVAEAMQVLEREGLLMRALCVRDYSFFYVGLTRLGRQALQTNTVRQHLGLSDTPPTG
jgi:hypothetical protein